MAATIPATPPPNYGSITQGGTLEELFKHFGMGKSSYRGDNPMASLMSFMGPLLASRVNDQLLFGNKLEGQRQGAIQSLLRNFQPGNIQANADMIRQRGMNAAAAGAPQQQMALKALGLGSGAQEGSIQSGFNQANQAGNDYLGQMYSPEGQSGILQAILQAISSGQTSDLGQMLGMNQQAMQDMQFKKSTLGGGSFGKVLGNIAGMYMGSQTGGMFGGGGMGGGGGAGSSSGWQLPVGQAGGGGNSSSSGWQLPVQW
jgi:hypothetical protein